MPDVVRMTFTNVGNSGRCINLVSNIMRSFSLLHLQFRLVSRIVLSAKYRTSSRQSADNVNESSAERTPSPGDPSFKTFDGPLAAYQAKVELGELRNDEHQMQLVSTLEALHRKLGTYQPQPHNTSWFKNFGYNNSKQNVSPPKGLYLVGSVGCGKTMLMDMFFETCTIRKKQRVHFHKFMLDVHRRIHELKHGELKRKNVKKSRSYDPISPVADQITEEAWLLCFDEFQVTDIADAMILRQLFTQLFENGVVVVATSNRHPDDLYKNGLNRANFVPFIRILKNFCGIHCLDSGLDYRMMTSLPAEDQIYFVKSVCDAQKEVDRVFEDLRISQNTAVLPRTLNILGRELKLPVTCGRVLDSQFDSLCRNALGAIDYLQICKEFDVVIIRNIPTMTLTNKAEARRFITLIDTLYDNKVKIVCSAETEAQGLFSIGAPSQQDIQANMTLMDDLGIQADSEKALSSIFTGEEELFAFERTVSRLTEMQTEEYWKLDRASTSDLDRKPASVHDGKSDVEHDEKSELRGHS